MSCRPYEASTCPISGGPPLEAARANGLVRIEIPSAGAIDVELSGRLQDAYGLRHAIVVDTPHVQPDSLLPELGEAAAELLSEITSADDVLGLAWSRAISAMTNALTALPAIPVVQLTGALARLDMADTSVDLVRQAARKSGGPAHFFYPRRSCQTPVPPVPYGSNPKSRVRSPASAP